MIVLGESIMASNKSKKIDDVIELNDSNYIVRDVSWMYFNNRVLKEAANEDVPLYERLSFLGIYSNNLDEFYKVRVASAKRIAETKGKEFKDEREEALNTLKKITSLTALYSKEYDVIKSHIFDELEKKGIHLIDEKHLNKSQQKFVHDYYVKNVAGYINPIIISQKANLSDVNDAHIYLAVKMSKKGTKKLGYALIPLPVGITGRFIKLPDIGNNRYVIYLDDIVRYHLSYIFEGLGYDTFDAYAFKFSKDAEMEVESDPEEGVLQSIAQAVKTRVKGIPIRAIFGAGIPDDLKNKLIRSLDIDDSDMISVGGRYHNNKDLMKFPFFGDASLKNEPWPTHEIDLVAQGKNMIDSIRAKDLLVHVPYESFDAFIRFLQVCAVSPRVVSIKTSIYRAAKNSEVVRALTQAARNGKKVTCMVELMARFDESSNISISQTLRDAGCEVLTGVEGFKVHGKIVSVKVKDGPDIAVISTGNFHEGNARTYTDCLLFTADKKIVNDINSIFEMIAKPYKQPTFQRLLVSPNKMQKKFSDLIDNEIKNHLAGKPSGIQIKINHITDKAMVEKLYEASRAGVKIDLLIRGNCSMITGIPGLSENIHIHAIIDRYLEHSRIFIFQNGGKPLYFMGSADWMPRNLYNRIEVVTPVLDKDCQKELQFIFDSGFNDNMKSFVVDGKGQNIRYTDGAGKIRSQEILYKHYKNK